MSQIAIFFLVVITLGLSLLLAWLGSLTLTTNSLGWFLLITGLIYFFGVIVVYWFGGKRFWKAQATGQIIKEEPEDLSFWAIVVGVSAAFFLPPLEYLYRQEVGPQNIVLQIAGWLLILVGGWIFLWARRTLGAFYSGHVSVVEGQPLIQTGPYRFIRHPAYAGYIFLSLGLTVGFSSLVGGILIPMLLLPAVIYRLNVEDKLLAEHFGDQFKEYADKTARLIPGVW